jgi:hypothetical protein
MSKLHITFQVYPYRIEDGSSIYENLNRLDYDPECIGTIDKNGIIKYSDNKKWDGYIGSLEMTLLSSVALEIKNLFNNYMLSGYDGFLIYSTLGDKHFNMEEIRTLLGAFDYLVFDWSVFTAGSGQNMIGANLITSAYIKRNV